MLYFEFITVGVTLLWVTGRIPRSKDPKFILMVLLGSVTLSMSISAYLGHLPEFPCELSHSGYRFPGYLFFATGLTFASNSMYQLHARSDHDRGWKSWIGHIGASAMLLTGLINDPNLSVIVLHSFCSIVCFVSYLVYLTAHKIVPWFGLMAFLCNYLLLFSCLWLGPCATYLPSDSEDVIATARSTIPYWIRVTRSLCQWVLIGDLMRLVLLRFTTVNPKLFPHETTGTIVVLEKTKKRD
jgi:hypothetical protein